MGRDMGDKGVFCGCPSVLNTFKGGSSSGKNPLATSRLFFLLGMDFGHFWGACLGGGYSSKVFSFGAHPCAHFEGTEEQWPCGPSTHFLHYAPAIGPGGVGWDLACFCYAILSGECPKPQST